MIEAPIVINSWGMLVGHLVGIFMLLRNAFVYSQRYNELGQSCLDCVQNGS